MPRVHAARKLVSYTSNLTLQDTGFAKPEPVVPWTRGNCAMGAMHSESARRACDFYDKLPIALTTPLRFAVSGTLLDS